jgi:hypothetical protein
LLLDENVPTALGRGLRRRVADCDLARVQDRGLSGQGDDAVLASAAADGRVLVSNDRRTIPGAVAGRLQSGAPVAGVVLIRRDAPRGAVLDDLVLLAQAADPEDLADRIVYLPL